ncbi:MAG TPA: hypothetical protein VHC69_04070 [Polyangiaceae bacterium]|nr:hypothetical protein [Polyangiaceae bacterium]
MQGSCATSPTDGPTRESRIDGNPSNVKLIDFGIARPLERSTDLTGSNTMLGTFGYMAPEQLTSSATVDAAR